MVPVVRVILEDSIRRDIRPEVSVTSTDSSENTVSDVGFPPSSLPQLFPQGELNDLT